MHLLHLLLLLCICSPWQPFPALDDSFTTSRADPAHLVGVRIVEEVGPVWIRLHEPELKQLPETQLKDVERDLESRGEACVYCHGTSYSMLRIINKVSNTDVQHITFQQEPSVEERSCTVCSPYLSVGFSSNGSNNYRSRL